LIIKKKYLIIVVLIVAISSTYYNQSLVEVKKNYTNTYSKVITSKYPEISILHSGNIILRRGYGMDSIVAANFSNAEKRYSHAGIIIIENDKVFVIHSQESLPKGYDGVVKESLSSYLKDVKIWAVYKFDIINSQKVLEYMKMMLKKNIKFDMDFDIKTNDKMYCSEFIYKSFNAISVHQMIKASKRFMSKQYVTITDLYINNYASLVTISHNIVNK